MIRIILLLLLFSPITVFADEVKQATICEEGMEWAPEINDCAIVVYDQEDIDLEEAKQKAEDMWAKIQAWYENLKTWKNKCMRPITQDNIDPNTPKGIIQSLEGKAYITRGIETFEAKAGMELLPGDTLATEQDSTAELDLKDTGILKISKETKFQIPNTNKTPKNALEKASSFFSKAWIRVKQCTQGEKFEIKTPSPGGGVRG